MGKDDNLFDLFSTKTTIGAFNDDQEWNVDEYLTFSVGEDIIPLSSPVADDCGWEFGIIKNTLCCGWFPPTYAA